MSLLNEARIDIIAGMRYLRQRGRAATPEYRELTEQLRRADAFRDALELAFTEKYSFPPPADFHGFTSIDWDRASEIFEACYQEGVL